MLTGGLDFWNTFQKGFFVCVSGKWDQMSWKGLISKEPMPTNRQWVNWESKVWNTKK